MAKLEMYNVRIHCGNCGVTTTDIAVAKGTQWETGVATIPCEHCGCLGCWIKIRTLDQVDSFGNAC